MHAHINLVESGDKYDGKHLEDVIRILPFLDPDFNSLELSEQPAHDYIKFLSLFEEVVTEESIKKLFRDLPEMTPSKDDLISLLKSCYTVK